MRLLLFFLFFFFSFPFFFLVVPDPMSQKIHVLILAMVFGACLFGCVKIFPLQNEVDVLFDSDVLPPVDTPQFSNPRTENLSSRVLDTQSPTRTSTHPSATSITTPPRTSLSAISQIPTALCEPLKSELNYFKVDLCRNPREGGVTVTVNLRRISTKGIDFARKLSKNMTTHRLFQEQAGPDGFHTILFGPECLATLPSFHNDTMTYSFEFPLTLSGNYSLRVHHVSTNFTSTDETHREIRQRFFRLVYEGKFDIKGLKGWNSVEDQLRLPNVCSPGEETASARWVYGPFTTGETWTAECLPECGIRQRSTLINGSWLEATIEQPVMGLQWVPYNCRFRAFTVHEANECLRGKSAFFFGDSHARMGSGRLLYKSMGIRDILPEHITKAGINGLVKSCDHSFPCIKELVNGTLNARSIHDISYSTHANFTIRYLWYPNPVWSAKKIDNRGYNFLFMNFGQWPAAGTYNRGFTPLNTFRASISRVVSDSLPWWSSADPDQRATAIWLDTTPILSSTSEQWRDNFRLRLMDREAMNILRPLGFHNIEVFKVIYPFMLATHDRTHYTFFQMDIINRIQLNHMCPL